MALHHELVSVEPRLLREAVEARWLAFRTSADRRRRKRAFRASLSDSEQCDRRFKAPRAARRAPDGQTSLRWERTRRPCRGGRPQKSHRSRLIGIAAVLDQSRRTLGSARAERGARSQNQGARRTERLGGLRSGGTGKKAVKLEAEQKEMRRQLDEDMRRMFGR